MIYYYLQIQYKTSNYTFQASKQLHTWLVFNNSLLNVFIFKLKFINLIPIVMTLSFIQIVLGDVQLMFTCHNGTRWEKIVFLIFLLLGLYLVIQY